MTERKVQFPSVLQIIQLFILEIKINRNGCLKKITDFQRISALTWSSESVLPFSPGGRGEYLLIYLLILVNTRNLLILVNTFVNTC